MPHSFVQQGTLDILLAARFGQVQADTVRRDVIPAPYILPARNKGTYFGRIHLADGMDDVHGDVLFAGQENGMAGEFRHPFIPGKENLPACCTGRSEGSRPTRKPEPYTFNFRRQFHSLVSRGFILGFINKHLQPAFTDRFGNVFTYILRHDRCYKFIQIDRTLEFGFKIHGGIFILYGINHLFKLPYILPGKFHPVLTFGKTPGIRFQRDILHTVKAGIIKGATARVKLDSQIKVDLLPFVPECLQITMVSGQSSLLPANTVQCADRLHKSGREFREGTSPAGCSGQALPFH